MFRFTIRELVLVTAVVAMGVAWWIDRSSLAKVGHAASEALKTERARPTMLSIGNETQPVSPPGRWLVTWENGIVSFKSLGPTTPATTQP